MSMTYAGIGSRATPQDVQDKISFLAYRLARAGWLLRTGGAEGADKAFLRGAEVGGGARVVHLPWSGYNGFPENQELILSDEQFRPCVRIASQLHPEWSRCGPGAQKLHARNVLILLGAKLDSPASAVIVWTPQGLITGGSGMGIRIAEHYGIPIFNLGSVGVVEIEHQMDLIELF